MPSNGRKGLTFRITALSGDRIATELDIDPVTPDKREKVPAAHASPDDVTASPAAGRSRGGFSSIDFRGIDMAQSENAWRTLTAVASAQAQPEPPQATKCATEKPLSLVDLVLLLLQTIGMIFCTCCCFPCAVAIRRRYPGVLSATHAKLAQNFPARAK